MVRTLMATGVRFSMARYTRPKPPSPITPSGWNPPVAFASSSRENSRSRAAMLYCHRTG
jgi:hypothetical protein